MDTKWKKSKSVFSFMAFATGLTVIVTNLIPAAGMVSAFGTDILEGQSDYQESGDFRDLISGKLSELIGVATAGKDDSGYVTDSTGAVYKFMDESYDRWVEEFQNEPLVEQEEAVAEETADYGAAADFLNNLEGSEAFGGNWDDYQAYLAEQQAHYEEIGLDSVADYDDFYGYGGNYYDYYGYDYGDQESRDAYMADMAQNKNLRYAVIYQNKLLYSNIDGFEDKAGQEWTDEDFSKSLDAAAYNFTLWYNRTGDGKVQIVKDGYEVDVYGDGIYSDRNRWRVPGYANFTIGESAKDAVVFLAAAKFPQLYIVSEDGRSGVTQYGGRLCRIRQNTLYLASAAERICIFMSIGVLLLAVGLLMRKGRRRAVEWIADRLQKICLEIKLSFLLILVILFTGMGGGVLGQLVWWIRNGLGYYNWSGDYIYEMARLTSAGGYLALWFWLIYLVVLDWRMNGKRQKKPIFDLLKVKDFKYPIQKRLVRRQRNTLIAEISLLLLFAGAVCALWMIQGELVNWISGGYGYNYAYETDLYEAVAEDMGYPFHVRYAYMLMAEVIFGALFVFTAITVAGLKKNRRLAVDIGLLTDRILAVREGSLEGELVLSEDTDLQEAADSLNQIQKGMETALAEQVKSERMKVELVTNVSHDIKTPLTSIISYAELLRQEKELPQHVKEYIQILGEKAERLRGIVQDVFEISKATSGQLPIQMEMLDMGKLLRQTLADMNDRISQSTLVIRTLIPEQPVSVTADGQRLYRVFQNLLQNALRYSLEGSRVYLSLTEEDGRAVARIKNTSGVELADSKDFTERFVRGDESRTDGGSGLGLSIAKSFTEACGGSLTVETDADLFTVTVSFPTGGEVPDAQSMQEEQAVQKGQDKEGAQDRQGNRSGGGDACQCGDKDSGAGKNGICFHRCL